VLERYFAEAPTVPSPASGGGKACNARSISDTKQESQ
jgi:hypothetical protein